MERAGQETSSSKFAWLTAPGRYVQPAHDIVVAGNEHFVAVPSLGAIVPGWMLVVPRRPMATLCLMNAVERQSLVTLRADLSERLRIYEGAVAAFEHGGASGSLVSCGVDQAHLHVVPLKFDLTEAALTHDMGWRATVAIQDLSEEETQGQEYLYAEGAGVSLIGFPKTPTSQWFRRLVAQECGVEEWDYKRIPNHKRLAATARELTRSRAEARQKN
jgi:ATP adenylyltransferase